MKRRLPLLVLLGLVAVALPVAARGITQTSWKLTSSGSSVSVTTGCGQFTIQSPDGAFCENSGSGSATASCTLGSSSTGRLVQAGQLFPEDLPCSGPDQADTIAVVSVSGTANIQIFREAYNP